MENNVKINLALLAAGRVANQLKSLRATSGGAAAQLKATRDQLRAVNKTAADLGSLRKLKQQVAALRGKVRDNTEAQTQHRKSLDAASASREQHHAKLQRSRTALTKLNKVMASGTINGDAFHREYARLLKDVELSQRQFNRASQQVRQHARQLKQLDKASQSLANTRRTSIARLSALKNKLRQAGVSTTQLDHNQQQLKQRTDALNSSLKTQQNRLDQIAKKQRTLNQLNRNTRRQMGTAVNGAATGMGYTYLATRGASSVARFMETGENFEATMSRVQSLSNLKRQAPQMVALEQSARHLGATTSFGATDIAGAQAFLAMANFTPNKIIAAMPGLLNMAKAGDIDLALSADISSNILGGFQLEADQMTRVSDILTQTFTSSNTNLQMLGETMKYIGPVAAAAHVELAEAAAMTGLLGDVGIQGSQAGTGLRGMLLRLAGPTGAAKEALQDLGVTTQDSNGNLRNVTDILEDLAWTTSDLGSAEKINAMKVIFGEEPAAAVVKLLDKAGTGQLRTYIEKIKNSDGTASNKADVMSANVRGDLAGLQSAWADLKIQIFGDNKGELRALVQTLTQQVRALGAWAKANPQTVRLLSKLAVGALAATAAMGALSAVLFSFLIPLLASRWLLAQMGIKLLPTLAKGALKTTGALKGSLGILGRLVKRLATTKLSLRGVISVLSTVGRALLFNPIGLVITALGVGALALIKYWQPVKQFFIGLWGPIKAAMQPVTELFSGLGVLLEPLMPVFDWLGEKLSALGTWFSDLLTPVKATNEQLHNAALAGEQVGKAIASVITWHIDLVKQFKTMGVDIIDGLLEGIKSRIGEVKQRFLSLADDVKNSFSNVLGIHSPSRVFKRYGVDTLTGYQQGIKNETPKTLQPVTGFAKKLIEIPKQILQPAFTQNQQQAITANPFLQSTNNNITKSIRRQALTLGASVSALSALPVAADITFDQSAPLAPAAAPVTYQGDSITINVYPTPGSDAHAITRQIEKMLTERDRAKDRRRRSALHD